MKQCWALELAALNLHVLLQRVSLLVFVSVCVHTRVSKMLEILILMAVR